MNGAAEPRTISWYVWASVVAASCAVIGLQWDISWHMSIGRDTFWTPAHLLIQTCAVIAGISCAILILGSTFSGKAEEKLAFVRVLGFYGPLGAFIAAWGGIAMIVSAPFDNWWHNAYGLDVQILSPPHTVLGLGILAVELGGLILILGQMNRAEGRVRRGLEAAFLYTGGLILTQSMIFHWEYESRVLMHSAIFYRAVVISAPLILIGVARAVRWRWAATIVASVYTAIWMAMLWILPLFPAEPKLGPVYQHVTHMIPMGFPLLLIAPAVAMDLLWRRLESWNKWLQAVVLGSIFLAVLMAVQWPFSDFLLSPAAHNWIFGSHYFAFMQPPDDPEVHSVFDYYEPGRVAFFDGLGIALAAGIVSARVGITWGNWMRKVRR